ncbi:MAG: putative lipopolysaccharide heptosyltransferase III [Desulfarculales bacterium]|jgi:heptosyltransferase-3|nr:putative lipopolysaccharide heptosyltransferase III [Desulfarculales bacterium]
MPGYGLKTRIDLKGIIPRRILVCKFGRLGDVLMMTPFCKALKDLFPGVSITALVYASTKEIVANCPWVDDYILADGQSRSFMNKLRKDFNLPLKIRRGRFDLYFDFSNGERGAYLGFLSGIKRRVGFTKNDTPLLRYLIPYPVPRRAGMCHEVVNYLEQLEALGFQVQAPPLQWRPDQESLDAAEDILQSLAIEDFVLIHPTSFWMFKAWEEDKNALVIDHLVRLGFKVVLSAGPDGRELAYIDGIISRLSSPQGVINLAGKLTLTVLGALIGKARLFFGADSAPMHLAAAMGTPTVAVFGPSSEVSWHPWMVKHRLLIGPCPEHPCHRAGCNDSGISRCLTSLPVEPVLQAIDELMETSA